jgi:hypothetical protein
MPTDTPEVRVGTAAEKVRLLSLSDLDKRCAAYRRTTDLIEAIEADLGGADRLSSATRVIVQRAAVLVALAANLESRWLAGEGIDPLVLCTIDNALKRLLETIGLRRVPREVTPTLEEYARRMNAEIT